MKRAQCLLFLNHVEFAESHKGPISNHKFNEAINGVFRSKKQLTEQDPKNKPIGNKTAVEKGQRTLDEMVQNGGVRLTDRRMIDKDKEHVHVNLSSQRDDQFS